MIEAPLGNKHTYCYAYPCSLKLHMLTCMDSPRMGFLRDIRTCSALCMLACFMVCAEAAYGGAIPLLGWSLSPSDSS